MWSTRIKQNCTGKVFSNIRSLSRLNDVSYMKVVSAHGNETHLWEFVGIKMSNHVS